MFRSFYNYFVTRGIRVLAHYVAAAIGGALLNYAQAPDKQVWLLPGLYSVLYYSTIKAPSVARAVSLGFVFNFFYLACNNFWIVNALSIDEAFVWASPFVALALPAYMATFTSVASWVLYLNRKRAPMIRASSFALTWSVMEVLRAYATFGFSMSAIGHSVSFSDSIAQTASILGVYGLSAALIFISVIPAEAALSHSVRKALVYSFSMCLVICSAYVWGARRLSLATPSYDYTVKLRIVQGGFTPHQLWRMNQFENAVVRRYLDLSMQRGFETITHFVWGESTLPMPVNIQRSNLWGLVSALPKNSFLLTGSPRSDSAGLFNSWVAVDNSTGQISAYYDKTKLVPFGEFLPFRPLLLKVFKYGGLNGFRDYDVGHGDLNVISLSNTPDFHVIICYETMFFGKLMRSLNESIDKGKKIQWIVNVTNDGWFGTSRGPYQHLAVAKLRAIESGLPFIRSTNTGVSAVYDGYGRMINSLPLGAQGIMDVHLPKGVARTWIGVIHKYTHLWIGQLVVVMIALITYSSVRAEVIPKLEKKSRQARVMR